MRGPEERLGAPLTPGTRPGGRQGPWSAPLVLALLLLLLTPPPCAPAPAPCEADEYLVGAECCPKCRPGFRVQQPCGEFTGTICVPCGPGTYTAHLNGLGQCLACRACDPALGLDTRRGCSPSEDALCGCAPGHVCVSEEAGAGCQQCQPHAACAPGQRVARPGNETQDTLCEDCPPGTFSPSGALDRCQPWTNCSWYQREAEPGTRSADAACGPNLNFLLFLLLLLLLLIPALVAVLRAPTIRRGKKWRPGARDGRGSRETPGQVQMARPGGDPEEALSPQDGEALSPQDRSAATREAEEETAALCSGQPQPAGRKVQGAGR